MSPGAENRATAVLESSGMLRAWEKRGECWSQVAGPWRAWVGQRGISERKREGDRKTPSGVFGIQRTMYGVAPNPGVRYRYHRVVCGDWWVEDPSSPHYNRFRHVRCGATPPFRVISEDMSRSPEAYKYLAVIDYNTHPVVPGRGSGMNRPSTPASFILRNTPSGSRASVRSRRNSRLAVGLLRRLSSISRNFART